MEPMKKLRHSLMESVMWKTSAIFRQLSMWWWSETAWRCTKTCACVVTFICLTSARSSPPPSTPSLTFGPSTSSSHRWPASLTTPVCSCCRCVCVCVCVWVSECVHACVLLFLWGQGGWGGEEYVCLRECVHSCLCSYTQTLCLSTHAHMHTHSLAHKYTHTHSCMTVFILHTHKHTLLHTNTHIHTHVWLDAHVYLYVVCIHDSAQSPTVRPRTSSWVKRDSLKQDPVWEPVSHSQVHHWTALSGSLNQSTVS